MFSHRYVFKRLYDSIETIMNNNKSVINILKNADLRILKIIKEPNATGLFLKLGNKLNAFPNSRCNLISECVKAVTPGTKNVFVDVK